MMEIIIRNITKDTMVDLKNDHTIVLPMDNEKLQAFLGNDEWIIVCSPIGEELTNITELNDLLLKVDPEELLILSEAYCFDEIKEMDENYTIINFTEETAQYNNGNGVFESDWWMGYVLHQLGYINFPFEYTDEMEDYVKFEQLWLTANSEGWIAVRHDGNLYLVKKWN